MRHKNPLVHYGILAFIYGTAVFTLISHTALHSVTHADGAKSCETAGKELVLTINDTAVSSRDVSAQRCDTLVLTNTGTRTHLMAIGEHSHHASYPNFHEQSLRAGDTLRLQLTETGEHKLHDHLDDDLHVNLSIR